MGDQPYRFNAGEDSAEEKVPAQSFIQWFHNNNPEATRTPTNSSDPSTPSVVVVAEAVQALDASKELNKVPEKVQLLNTLPTKNTKRAPKKNRIACVACQSRKQRCDEKRPCSRCVKNGRECVDRSESSITSVSVIQAELTKVSSTIVVDNDVEMTEDAMMAAGESYFEQLMRQESPEWMRSFLAQLIYECSPLYLEEWLRSQGTGWKFILSYIHRIIGKEDADKARKFAIDNALTVCRPEHVDYFKLLNEAGMPDRIHYDFQRLNYLEFHPDDLKWISAVYNVKDISASDLAIYRSVSVLTPPTFEDYHEPQVTTISHNFQMDQLLNISLEEFAELYTNADRPLLVTDPSMCLFHDSFWRKLQVYACGAVRDDVLTWMENMECVNNAGTRIPCTVYSITRYQKLETGGKILIKMHIMRPHSPTFNPSSEDLKTLLARTANPAQYSYMNGDRLNE